MQRFHLQKSIFKYDTAKEKNLYNISIKTQLSCTKESSPTW